MDRLVEKVGEALKDVRVIHKNSLDTESTENILTCEKVLPSTSLRERLENYIGDFPLYRFLILTITNELQENYEYSQESVSHLLSELEEYRDIQSVAKRLVKQFNSLPWEYTISIQLNDSLKHLATYFTPLEQFAKIIKVVQSTPDFIKTYPLKSGIKRRDNRIEHSFPLFSLNNTTPWIQGGLCVQITTQGFIDSYGSSESIKNVISTLKSFLGLCFALGILEVSSEFFYEAIHKKGCYVHKKVGEKWEIETIFELPIDLSKAINSLNIDYSDKKPSDPELQRRIQTRLITIVTAFNEQKKARNLLLAGEWFFDSYCGSNEFLCFVQAIIVLEILLGDKSESDLMGLTALLRNRCAYLIGTSQSQRDEILKLFGEIYEVRSKIVHSGKTRLNSKEKELLRRLKWICRRVIAEEIILFMEDKKKITTEF
jgi:hypothetical protein